MFVAGDDPANKPKVIELVTALGFDVVDAGPLRNARLLEAHAMLWIELALKRGLGRDWGLCGGQAVKITAKCGREFLR